MFELCFPLSKTYVTLAFNDPPTQQDYEALERYVKVAIKTFEPNTYHVAVNDFHNEYRADPPTHRKKDGNL